MRLSKITIAGFKSFADATVFEFDSPIIGIVGPNGCGKSNVVDAIKWVLGERSAKSLRGEAMLDVIFAGSAVRKPLGAAAVTLTFDNPVINAHATQPADRRFLTIDTDEVGVTRRLYRDGRSEYLINGNKVRLKDIRELFLDTGIGTNAYSIIEQGRVAAMLQANPAERRGILEEAAGVARFKTRRTEAERKLERSEVNLVRVREQLASTERRLRTVRSQAEKARKFIELDKRLRSVRTDVVLDQFHELHTQLHGLTSQLTLLEQERQQIVAKVIELEDTKQQAEIDRHTLQADHQTLIQKSTEHESTVRHSQQRIEMMDRSILESKQQIDDDRSRLNEFQTREKELAGQRECASEQIASSAQRLAEIDRQVDRIASDHATFQQKVVELQGLLSNIQDELEEQNSKEAQLRAEAQSAKERLDSQIEQQNRAATIKQTSVEELETFRANHEETTQQIALAKRTVEQHKAVLQTHDNAAHSLGELAEELANDLEIMRQQRAASGSRLHLLQEMQHAREGLTDAVKHVLDNSEKFPQVKGMLGDAIDANHADAHIVEIALGQNVQLLLVESDEAIAEVEEALGSVHGRVGLLPMNASINNASLSHNPATPLLSLIQISDYAKHAAAKVLGRTAVVNSMQTAIEMRHQMPGWRFVTNDAELLEPDGRIFVGKTTTGDQKGWLTRRIEINALTIECNALDQQIEQRQSQLSDLLDESEQAKQQQRDSATRVRTASNSVVEHEYRIERIDDDIHRCNRQVHVLTEEFEELSSRIAKSKQQSKEAEQNADDISSFVAQLSVDRAKERTNLDQSINLSETTSEQLTAARVDLGQVGEKHEADRRELRHIDATIEESTRQRTLLQDQVARRLVQFEQFEASKQESQDEIERCRITAAKCKQELDEYNTKMATADTKVEQSAIALQASRELGERIVREFHALELSRREAEVKRENLEDRTLEELELDVSVSYDAWRMNTQNSSRPTENREEIEEESEVLRLEIKKLGNVNLDSIEEEVNLKERNVDLAQQVIDIDSSVESLNTLIEELEECSKTKFEETFTLIREHFSGPQGMFRKMFGGGSADLIMLPDEDGNVDLLEAGIEIKAKPPGKKPRVISQLSGGEQAMTAVALLLSIFKAKPSPFCILDEVDAALDESNTHRFASSLHHFLEDSHFIVITHKKRTMMECDKLYGVTMQERGVSKHVAVTIDEIGNKGEISTLAHARSASDDLPLVETSATLDQLSTTATTTTSQ